MGQGRMAHLTAVTPQAVAGDNTTEARRQQYVERANAGVGQALHTQKFRGSIGNYTLVDVDFDPAAAWHAVVRYEVPLDWCHSFDPSQPIGEGNAPVAQGGLLCALMDNAMTTALRVATGGRFQTTLSMTNEFLAPGRPGLHWAEAKCTMIGGTVGFAVVTLFADEARTDVVARSTSTNKLRKPAKL